MIGNLIFGTDTYRGPRDSSQMRFGISRTRTKIAINKRKIANTLRRAFCLMRLLTYWPAMLPAMPIDAIQNTLGQSISICCPNSNSIRPTAQLLATITRLVPIARRMGNRTRNIRAGTIMNPPPTPTKPVTIPTSMPCNTNHFSDCGRSVC